MELCTPEAILDVFERTGQLTARIEEQCRLWECGRFSCLFSSVLSQWLASMRVGAKQHTTCYEKTSSTHHLQSFGYSSFQDAVHHSW